MGEAPEDRTPSPVCLLLLREKIGGNRLLEHNDAILRPDKGVAGHLAARLEDK